MTCYNPISGFRTPDGVVFSELGRYDIIGRIDIACGQCIGCRMRRASDWALRCEHEAQGWERNCVVALTYADENLPPDGSLRYRDFQLFMKRLRQWHGLPVRFFMCGEYGELRVRPHYHAILFNCDFDDRVVGGVSGAGQRFYDSADLARLWGLGRVSVQDLCPETIGYVTRYIMKKVLGPDAGSAYESVDSDGVVIRRVAEFARMSLKPGIGDAWYRHYMRSCFPHDFVVSRGVKRPVPKFYSRMMKKSGNVRWDNIEQARIDRALESRADCTDQRLATREVVHMAQVANLKRGTL